MAPGISQGERTMQVRTFVADYFTAINDHDFAAYTALLDARSRADETRQEFRFGFGTTRDSDASITGITTVSAGITGVTITFVSHQNIADSITDSACTDWDITLFLRRSGAGYVLGPAPPGYRAEYYSC
jgi:hypothetical protein